MSTNGSLLFSFLDWNCNNICNVIRKFLNKAGYFFSDTVFISKCVREYLIATLFGEKLTKLMIEIHFYNKLQLLCIHYVL